MIRKTIIRFSDSNIGIYLFFVILACLGFYQVAFFKYSLQWDMLDAYLPWRYFITDCIHNKTLPFWNPYQHFGYPIFGDLRTVLNPEYNIIGLAGKYNMYMLHFFFIFYVSLAGYAMYRLIQYVKISKFLSISAAICYMFSGFIVSEGQDMSSISGSAFLVFSIYYFLKLQETGRLQYVFKTSVALFLMIVNAYPAISIVLAYLLFSIFCLKIAESVIEKNYNKTKVLLWQNALLGIIVLGLCSFLVISLLNSQQYVSRYSGLSVNRLNDYPFTPQSLISLLFPYATVKGDFFDTISVMNNLYLGIISLLFIVMTFFRRLNRLEILLLIFGIICLWASFGNDYKMRVWLAHLPLMDMFRTPAFLRPFIIIPLLLIAFKTASILIYKPNFLRQLRKISIILIACLSLIFLYMGIKGVMSHEISFSALYRNLFFQEQVSYKLHIFIQAFFQIMILGLFVYIIRKPLSFNRKAGIVAVFVMDLFITTQLNIRYTVVNPNSPLVTQAYFDEIPQSFPLPQLKPMATTSQNNGGHSTLWRNINTFTKVPTFDGFNSFKLALFDSITDYYIQLHDSLLRHPLVYFSENIKYDAALKSHPLNVHPNDVFVDSNAYNLLSKTNFTQHPQDTLYLNLFKPGEIHLIAKTDGIRFVNVLQSWFPGWNLYVDGKPATIFRVNILFQGFLTQPGHHEYRLVYENTILKYSFFFTYGLLLILILTILFINIYEKQYKLLSYAILLGLAILLVLLGIYFSKSTLAQQQLESENKILSFLESKNDSTLVILNTDRNNYFRNNDDNILLTRTETYYDVSQLYCTLKSMNSKFTNCIFYNSGVTKFREVEMIVKQYFPETEYYSNKNGEEIYFLRKQKKKLSSAILIENTTFQHDDRFVKIGTPLYKETTSGKVLTLDSVYKYSPSLEFPLEAFKMKHPEFHFTISFKNVRVTNRCHLVATHKRSGRVLELRYFPIFQFSNESSYIDKAFFIFTPANTVRKNDKVFFFIYNEGGQTVYIQHMKTELYNK